MEADEVYFERLDDVLVIAAQIRERRLPLSLPVDSLALIFADGATCMVAPRSQYIGRHGAHRYN
jgi:hypothetical protein